MTETVLSQQPVRRFDLPRARALILRPRQVFQEMASESRATWLTPMLVLTVTAILVVVVAGYLKSRSAMMGEVELPQDWQYWTPDMQENYMVAQQARQGPVFMYVMPMIGSLTGLWLGWLLLAALLHFGSTLLGGRGSMLGALNIVAWASLPFAVRDLLRIVFMLAVGHAIVSPSLSGFVSTTGFVSKLLTHLDIFLVWNVVLLVIGLGISDSLPRNKAVVGVIVIMLLVLLAQAGLGALSAGVGGTAVQRPFF
ncbi:MAG TPA: YIP1 family protein [Anaerolineales bacterium]|nr:YIP1 family protein [Anaerolineales bacterium]